MKSTHTDVAVVGGGLIGSIAALAVARFTDRSVLHVAPTDAGDERTTALLADAIDLLERLDVWERAEPFAAALRTMMLLDGSKRLLRPMPLSFEASEIDRDAFGYNIRNADLLDALRGDADVARRVGLVRSAARSEGAWHLELDDGADIVAPIVLAADGRNSILREAAGIGARRWSYPQVALVTTFAHELPHRGISAEFHTETGPFTQVPLPGTSDAPHRSSLVWVVEPGDVPHIQGLSMDAASRRISEALQYMFGEATLERPLSGYPLAGLTATTFGQDGILLVGEAAHVFPPIGAQGANLGFRDVMNAVEVLEADADDPQRMAERYAHMRRSDVVLRTIAVDALNRSLLTDLLPVQAARAIGTSMLAGVAPLRRAAMRAGLSPRR